MSKRLRLDRVCNATVLGTTGRDMARCGLDTAHSICSVVGNPSDE